MTRCFALALAALAFWFSAVPVLAQQVIGSTIDTDTTATDTQETTSGQLTYTVNINDGATLTIGAGTGYGILVNNSSAAANTNSLEFATNAGGGHLVITGRTGSGVYSSFGGMGAHSVLDFSALTSVAFGDNTSDISGGAIYSFTQYGTSSSVTLGDNAAFSGNTANESGGAIYSRGNSSASNVTLGADANFSNNSASHYGGAIFSDGETSSTVEVGAGTTFNGNTARWFGGAIYAYSPNGAATVSIKGGTLFTGNLSGDSGGSIYIKGASAQSSKLTLDTADGDIVFTGNKSGVTFNSDGTTSGGDPNAVYLDIKTDITISGDANVYFDDPLDSNNAPEVFVANTLTKTGAGFVQFRGKNYLTYNDAANQKVDVNGGTFRLAGLDALFQAGGNSSEFNVAAPAALAGQGTVKAGTFNILGSLSPDSYDYQAPADPRQPSALKPAAGGTAIGTLTLDGDVDFTAATLDIDMASATVADKIEITGAVTYDGGTPAQSQKLNLTSFVGGASGLTIMTATGGGILAGQYTNANITVGGMALDGRMNGAVSLSQSTGTELKITTNNVASVKNTWKGTANNNWNLGTYNWSANGNTFAHNDYVIFDDTANNTYRAPNLAGNAAYVSGMNVTGNVSYTFQNGSIIGSKDTFNNAASLDAATENGILLVNGGATATFNNVYVDFEGGMLIGDLSDSGHVYLKGGGTFSDNMGINLVNNSILYFRIDSVNYADGYAYNGVIIGDGVIDKDDNGTLTLGGNNGGFSGGVRLADGELRLTNAKAAGRYGGQFHG